MITVKQQLTPEEIEEIFAMYPWAKQAGSKFELHQIQHISDRHIYDLCYAYTNIPFCDTEDKDWNIERSFDVIKVWEKNKKHSYVIDRYNGNINAFIYNRQSTLVNQAAAVQLLLRKRYALPYYCQPKHWANGKTPLQLGLASPHLGPLNRALKHIFKGDNTLINDWFFNKRLEEIQLNNVKIFNAVLDFLCEEHNLDINKFL